VAVLSIDFETRSTVDLKKCGVYVYAEHPDTDVWCLAWAFDDEEPEIWEPGMTLSSRVIEHINAGGEIRAWNAQFERIIWREIMVKRYGAPAIRDEQFVCSAAEAAAMALPRALGQAAKVLGVEQEKDDKGHRLMMTMARPRSVGDDGSIQWWDVPERKARLFAYCQQDVRTERAVSRALRRLTPREREVYLLDQRINDRGVRIDSELVEASAALVAEGVERANRRVSELTGGEVNKITSTTGLASWLTNQGLETESVAKPAIAALLARDDIATNLREVMELRADAGRSSVAKLKSMVYARCTDGMARGLLLYHAASTGRWAGRLIQPQNFPRGEVDKVEDFIPTVLDRDYDRIDLIAHPIIVVLSLLRSMLTARPGHELISADFSAIEARALNWLAGQDDVVEMFRQYDAGDKTMDPYKQMAVRMGRAPSVDLVTKQDRQAGKAAELGCGFQMGWKKFISAAWDVYQVEVSAREAKDAVASYRATHAIVKEFWDATETACIEATLKPGVPVKFGDQLRLRAVRAGAYLYIVLPSGRPLCYAAPSVRDKMTPWGEMKPALHFWTVDGYTKQWGEMSAYGGLLVENIVQAVARDLIAEALLRVEAAGYLPVLSVHDEAVAEVPVGFGDLKEFERLMSELPAWGTGCPVAAEGWRGFRYRK
jgi:DNA polymerase